MAANYHTSITKMYKIKIMRAIWELSWGKTQG
jgi:hypothetical protein